MKQFTCNCYGENKIVNDDFSAQSTVFNRDDDPSIEGEIYCKPMNFCPKCGKPTIQIESYYKRMGIDYDEEGEN